MKRKFEMIEKGYKYTTEGYTLEARWEKVNLTHCGFTTLDRYGDRKFWKVFPDNEYRIYSFKTLQEAKNFIINRDKGETA